MTATPLPHGFAVAVDSYTRQLDSTCLFGGSPARVVRLSGAGPRAWAELQRGPIASAEAGDLARRLTDAGLVHPVPPVPHRPLDVTVLIPVHDRPHELNRCLAALGGRHPVVVVDDASTNPDAIAEVCDRHGAALERRLVNGGPGAARDHGLHRVRSDFVAFLDSDTMPTPDWIERLAGHFADPLVAAVAPRIVGDAPDTWAGRYTRANGSLDLGTRPARVAPGSSVSYVPTAALVVRRAAVLDVAADGTVFDPSMRVGEDVDLIWRLHEAGWRVRYEPGVEVRHEEPSTWRALLTRRYRYGTSAAPLATRHPDAIAPLVLHAWPTATVAAVLARRPVPAAAAYAASVVTMRRRLRRAGIPQAGVPSAMARATEQTGIGVGRYATQVGLPVLAAVAAGPGRSRGARVAAACLVLVPPLSAWLRRRPDLDLPRYVAGHVADDVAYGAGVWAGSLRERTLRALRPAVIVRPLPRTQRAGGVGEQSARVRTSLRKVSRGHELV